MGRRSDRDRAAHRGRGARASRELDQRSPNPSAPVARRLRACSRGASDGSTRPPTRALTRDGIFDSAQAETLADADADHWWFRSKTVFVRTMARAIRGCGAGRAFADVGGGA